MGLGSRSWDNRVRRVESLKTHFPLGLGFPNVIQILSKDLDLLVG